MKRKTPDDEKAEAKHDALRRMMGMDPVRDPDDKKHGSHHRKVQKMNRRISRPSQQVQL